MTTLPTLLVVLLGLASPVVAVVAIVAAELRERNRQEHELKMQRGELEDRRLSRLREDRLRSYSTLAGLSKVIEPTPAERSASDLAEVLAEIELLTDDPRLLKTAGELVAATALTRVAAWRNNRNEATQEQVDSAMDTLKKCRVEFNRLAKEELEARLSEDGYPRSNRKDRPDLYEPLVELETRKRFLMCCDTHRRMCQHSPGRIIMLATA